MAEDRRIKMIAEELCKVDGKKFDQESQAEQEKYKAEARRHIAAFKILNFNKEPLDFPAR